MTTQNLTGPQLFLPMLHRTEPIALSCRASSGQQHVAAAREELPPSTPRQGLPHGVLPGSNWCHVWCGDFSNTVGRAVRWQGQDDIRLRPSLWCNQLAGNSFDGFASKENCISCCPRGFWSKPSLDQRLTNNSRASSFSFASFNRSGRSVKVPHGRGPDELVTVWSKVSANIRSSSCKVFWELFAEVERHIGLPIDVKIDVGFDFLTYFLGRGYRAHP